MSNGSGPSRVNIGFMLAPTQQWLGGVNYYRNLFHAIGALGDARLHLTLFVGRKADESLVKQISNVQQVVKTSLLDRKSLPWLVWRITRRLFGSDLFAHLWLRRHRIAVFSHSDMASGIGAKAINWIPDFQHLHLPQLFSEAEREQRSALFAWMARQSDLVVLSSETARRDFVQLVPAYAAKARVLNFVSRPDSRYWALGTEDEASLRARYGIRGAYFYLPNQFWKHKNHVTALRGFAAARARGLDATLICSGSMNDYRNPEHADAIRHLITELGIEEYVKLLGIVPYSDVYGLIRFATAVINPSLFEGWSSTVEECKSVGKRLILSDIPVHREQTSTALFFSPEDSEALADCLLATMTLAPQLDQTVVERDLREREHRFGVGYRDMVLSVVQREPI